MASSSCLQQVPLLSDRSIHTQVSLCNRYKAASALEVLQRWSQPMTYVKTASPRENDGSLSLLKGMEGSICRQDSLRRGIFCPPWAWVRDLKRKLPFLVWPSGYFLLLGFFFCLFVWVGSDEVWKFEETQEELQGLGTTG